MADRVETGTRTRNGFYHPDQDLFSKESLGDDLKRRLETFLNRSKQPIALEKRRGRPRKDGHGTQPRRKI
jgi:hypothetical protein